MVTSIFKMKSSVKVKPCYPWKVIVTCNWKYNLGTSARALSHCCQFHMQILRFCAEAEKTNTPLNLSYRFLAFTCEVSVLRTLTIKGFGLYWKVCCADPGQRISSGKKPASWANFSSGIIPDFSAFSTWYPPQTVRNPYLPPSFWMFLEIGIHTSWSINTKFPKYKKTKESSFLNLLGIFSRCNGLPRNSFVVHLPMVLKWNLTSQIPKKIKISFPTFPLAS